MTVTPRMTGRKYFTVEQANAMLPLVRAIVRDIVEVNKMMDESEVPLEGLDDGDISITKLIVQQMQQFEPELDRMLELEQELTELGIELKDGATGLIDFLAQRDGRDVYLCWKLGEPSVAHWHELDAGFRCRKKL